MSTLSLFRGLNIGIVILGLLCGVGLVPSAASADAASADDLRALVARDGWVLVRVELASAPDTAGVGTSAVESQAQADSVGALMFALPEGSYADVERLSGGAGLAMQVDAAGLDGLFASPAVARVAPAAMPVAMRRVAAGESHSLAVKSDGSLWAWGWNHCGQLGDGTTTTRPGPVYVMDGVAAVAAGKCHTLALKTDGSLWAWGLNQQGQIGDGTQAQRLRPVRVMTGVTAVAAGLYQTLALKTDGSLWGWGRNDLGQIGDGTAINRLLPVYVMDGVSAVAAGMFHTLALQTSGSLWTWGFNGEGQLGDGTQTSRRSPVRVLTGVAAVSVSGNSSFAIKTDATLWGWGRNERGEIGDGTVTTRLLPVSVISGVNAVAGGGGAYSVCTFAIKTDGSLLGWGWNDYGQVGDGTTITRVSPAYVMTGVAAVASGGEHSIAMKTDGSFWAWGYNGSGQVGDWTYRNRTQPVRVALTSPLPKPASPTQLTAQAISGTQINLAWRDNSTNELGFRLERTVGTSPLWLRLPQLGPNVTQFSNVGLTPGLTYRYRVAAYGLGGTSAYSNQVTATTPAAVTKPAAPTNLIATPVSPTKINLTWQDKSTNEQGFRIQRKIGTAAWVQIKEVPANSTSFANLGLKANTRYTYRVRAFNAAGVSAWATSTLVKTPQ